MKKIIFSIMILVTISINIYADTADICQSKFPGALSSTNTLIELNGNGDIYNDHAPLITKNLIIRGPGQCDGTACTKSNTLAKKYEFSVDLGSGKDGTINLSGTTVYTITSPKEFSSFYAKDNAVINIEGNIALKISGLFHISENTTLNINGNVTIYADDISIAGRMQINTENGTLKMVANNIDWRGNTTVNSHANPNLVLLSKGKVDIHGTSDLTAIIYAETTAELYGSNNLRGAITADTIRMHGHDYVTYDSGIVNDFCKSEEPPVISIDNVSQLETDEGNTTFVFTVTFSHPAPANAGFWVTFTDGVDANSPTGTAGHEASHLGNGFDPSQRDFGGVARKIYIPEGTTEYKIEVPVLGDLYIEPDEEFYVDIYKPDNVLIPNNKNKIRGIGTILNDDINISLNAMTTEAGFDGNITTQIAGKAFELKIKAYDALNHRFIKDVNITKVTITDENGNDIYNWSGSLVTNIDGTATLDNIIVNQAVKVATVKIDADYGTNKYQNVTATDKFAIRPDRFVINIPSPNIAGKIFTMQLKAISANSSSTPVYNYNEEVNASFKINYNEKLSSCKTGELNLSNITFTNGTIFKELIYSEVGKLDFNISEIKGSEFALIDINDTPDKQRLITKATISDIVFIPAKAVVNWSLKNGDSINNYTYFGNFQADPDAQNMAASLDINVSIQNALGKIVENFTQGCYANDINMDIHYRLEGEKDTEYIMHTQYIDMNATIRNDVSILPAKLSMDGAFESVNSIVNIATNFINFIPLPNISQESEDNHQSNNDRSISSDTTVSTTSTAVTEPSAEGTYTGYKMDASLFSNGIGVKIAKFNFDRKTDTPLNPVTFKVIDLIANFGTIPTEVSLTGSNEVKFLYARAYIPDQKIVGEKSNINVFYEVYCNKCNMSKYNFTNLQESQDSIYWYILDNVNETYSDYEIPSGLNDLVTSTSGEIHAQHSSLLKEVTHLNASKMYVEVYKSPSTTRIKYKPKSYLVYNRFNPAATTHSFTANFSPKQNTWAGKGDVGLTVDTVIDPRSNVGVIDW